MAHGPGGVGHHYDPASGYTIVDVQDTEEGPAPGTAIKPIVEEYEGQNFPYRGIETHGVDPLYSANPPEEYWEGGTVVVDTDKIDEEPERVVPVRIVAESTREHETWTAQQITIGENPMRIVGRDKRRTVLKMKNLDELIVIYVGPSEMSTKPYLGYPIDPGMEFSLSGSDQLWAVTATGEQAIMAVLIEYTTGG